MAASLLLACGLNEQKFPPFVLLREESGVDGSFFITSVLGQRLKVQSSATVLVCLQHTVQHYATAGLRLGFNINMARERGNLVLIEPLHDISINLFSSKYLTQRGSIPDTLFNEITESVRHALESKSNCTVIIDNVTALIDLGCDESQVLRFCTKLIDITNEQNVSMLLKLNTSDLYYAMERNLEDLSTTEIELVKLKSGDFKEVDGKIVCRLRCNNGFGRSEKSVLYKVNDRNVKIFQPGEVGVKL